jgi:hypothetical protein
MHRDRRVLAAGHVMQRIRHLLLPAVHPQSRGEKGEAMNSNTRCLFITELQLPLGVRTAWGVPELADGWLSEIQAMRGRVIYDRGHRPSFRLADGSYADADAKDPYCYHILVRSGGNIVGCARVMPLVGSPASTVESSLGTEAFEGLIAEIGTTRDHTCEASRWIVTPEFRGRGLGFHVVAASWAVARWLGMRTAFVSAGTRERQDRALIKMGAHPVLGLSLTHSQVFDDELRVLYFDVVKPSDSMIHWIDRMTMALGLECLMEKGETRASIMS